MSSLAHLSVLNPRQQDAVCWSDGHLLVLAGAGSGKTRVLVTRIAWLMETQKVPLQSLLVVTFTNKAARELVSRIEQLLGSAIQHALIGTFHHICHHILRIHAQAAGLRSGFDIIDHGDQVALLKRILKEMNIATDVIAPNHMCQLIHKAKQSMQRIAFWDGQEDRLSQIMRRVYEAYEQRCQEENLVDFTEILLRCYDLFQTNDELRKHYQHRLRHIMVDEFQDTNALQYAWLCLLARDSDTQLFVVGDDDQSIYSFRGADTSNMSLFIRDFAGENVVRLEQNYRSRPMILEAANALIARNTARLGKKLWTEAADTDLIPCVIAPDDLAEAQWVVSQIVEIQERTPDWRIAILYRTNVQSRYFEQALFAQGLTYQMFGGLRFLDRAEVKHVLAYLRLMVNPSDNTAFLRVINFPARGIGEKTLARLAAVAQEAQVSYLEACAWMTGAKATVLKSFVRLIDDCVTAAKQMSLSDFMPHVLMVSGIQSVYAQATDAADKQTHFDQLISLLLSYQEQMDSATTPCAWDVIGPSLASLQLDGHDWREEEAGERPVHLMTIHMAKGLEYDAVFVTGLEQGLFPNEKSLAADEPLEEERRLMYVAMTRAKKALFLSCARRRHLYNQTFFSPMSQFLSEIPARFLHVIDCSAQASHASRSSMMTASVRATEIGRRVQHARFGTGVVIAAQGTADDRQVTVRFDHGETKTLLLAWAPLSFLPN